MKIKTNTELLDYQGVVIKGSDDKAFVLGAIIANILGSKKSDDDARSWKLGKAFATEQEVDLTADDVVFIKNILKTSDFTPIITGQIIEILEK